MIQLKFTKKFYHRQIIKKKPKTKNTNLFPNFTPHPRHTAVIPINYLETIIKHFFSIENACGYALDSGMCSKFDVERMYYSEIAL